MININKKLFFSFAFILMAIVGVLAINKTFNNSSNNDKENASNNNNTLTTSYSNKKLVVYFSKAGENYNVGNVEVGNTSLMAAYIKEYLNADSFEIIPVKAYSSNYKSSTEEAKKEKDENVKPEIKNKLDNIRDYDIIFLGYPIWWGGFTENNLYIYGRL